MKTKIEIAQKLISAIKSMASKSSKYSDDVKDSINNIKLHTNLDKRDFVEDFIVFIDIDFMRKSSYQLGDAVILFRFKKILSKYGIGVIHNGFVICENCNKILKSVGVKKNYHVYERYDDGFTLRCAYCIKANAQDYSRGIFDTNHVDEFDVDFSECYFELADKIFFREEEVDIDGLSQKLRMGNKNFIIQRRKMDEVYSTLKHKVVGFNIWLGGIHCGVVGGR